MAAGIRDGAGCASIRETMDLEEHTLDDSLQESCGVCGARLTAQEIEASREAGGPFLCSVHAAESVPAEEIAADEGDAAY
jgi:hypothetical protein